MNLCSCGHGPNVHDPNCSECACPGWTRDSSPVEIMLNGTWPIRLPPFRAYRPQFASTKGWERQRIESIHSLMPPGSVLYDCGSECGDLSALHSTLGIRTVLIEANRLAWPSARACFDANGLRPPVACWVGFAGPHSEGDASHSVGDWPEEVNGVVTGETGFLNVHERSSDIGMIAIDDMPERLGIPPPDGVTMDCESGEAVIVRGCERTFRGELTDGHRPHVWISVHPERMIENFRVTPDDLFEFMYDCGYPPFEYLAYSHELHVLFRGNPRPPSTPAQ